VVAGGLAVASLFRLFFIPLCARSPSRIPSSGRAC